ncbi:signal peptide peptidase SppA, 36K type, partial [Candidatus Magnetoovum chiemensis]
MLLLFISAILGFLSKPLPIGDKIALINIEGTILDSKATVDQIEEYREDSSVKAIVIRVDSPGGAVVPSQEINDAIKKTTKIKTVVVSMGSLAASGGYYIS